MASLVSYTYVDYLDKLGQVSFILPQIDAANIVATTGVNVSALTSALNTLTRGNQVSRNIQLSSVKFERMTPSDNDARRSSAVQFHYFYEDGNATMTPGYVTVPIADWDAFSFPAGQDTVQRANFNAAEEALATAMESYTESPDGTQIAVNKIVAVGRA